MLAAMRPTHAYPLTAPPHSRPDSRASSHGSSPAVTPSRTKAERAKSRSAAQNTTSSATGKKSSTQRKPIQQKQSASYLSTTEGKSDEFAKVSSQEIAAARSVQTPGLLSLSKPLSELQAAASSSPSPAKGKKGRSDAAKKGESQARSRRQRSVSPHDADGSTRATASGAKAASRSSRRSGKGAAAAAALQLGADDKTAPSVDLLSKSAPSLSHLQAKASQKPSDARFAPPAGDTTASTGEASGRLTWQQELLRSNSSGPASKSVSDLRKPVNKRQSAQAAIHAKQHDGILAQPQQVQNGELSALTWQQELLGGGKKRTGPRFDVFADARDAETFGDGGSDGGGIPNEAKGRRRARADSVGSGAVKGQKSNRSKTAAVDIPLHIDDLFNSISDVSSGHRRGPSAGAALHAQDAHPSTPAKKQAPPHGQHPSVAAAIAYAGPNFHNSPSPASLPAPKFSSRLNKGENGSGSIPTSSLGASSSSASGSDDEYEARRNVRSTTAPPEIHTPSKVASAVAHPPKQEGEAAPASRNTEPGATVESLLARMMGGVKFSM